MTATHGVSIAIVTKDRRTELERAVRSALAQGAAEVIVVDDASSDGTPALVAREFPDVRLVQSAESRGYIVRRNEAAELARSAVIVSIDDDAEFGGPDTIERLMSLFDDPRIGAVALPHVDLLQGEQVLQQSPTEEGVYVAHSFRGTAYAVRRDLFRSLGGFPESFFHQSEEQDFCLRLLDLGHVVALGRTPPVRHYASPKRDNLRAWVYGPRNDVLFAWRNVPLPALVPRLGRVTAHGLLLGFRVRRPDVFTRSLASGYGKALVSRRDRKPVARKTYRLYSSLERGGPRRLEELPL